MKLFLLLKLSIIFELYSLVTSNFLDSKIKKLIKKNQENFRFYQTNEEIVPNITPKNHSWLNVTRERISEMAERILDTNYKDLTNKGDFVYKQRGRFDFLMNDAEIKELFQYMLFREQRVITQNSLRIFATLYIKDWVDCDADASGAMTMKEFKTCMTNSTYLNSLVPPPIDFASKPGYNTTDGYYSAIFALLDDKRWGYLNFLQFMYLRLYSFSWRYCSVFGPYIDKNGFECALDVVSGYKTLSKNKVSNIYDFALELSNVEHYRSLDFIAFLQISKPVRLFAKINSKEDEEITKAEFNQAIDTDILPPRYSQDTINSLFFLIDQKDKYADSIDLQSFIFYDFFLNIFDIYSSQRRGYLNLQEFTSVISKEDDLFPLRISDEISLSPQYNITANSYRMYMFSNVLYGEQDHLYKSFLEMKTETKYRARTRTKINPKKDMYYPVYSNSYNGTDTKKRMNITYSLNLTAQRLFTMLDLDDDGFINYYDFASLVQIGYIFSKSDKYLRGRLNLDLIREKINNWYDYPTVSYRLKDKVYKLTQLKQDLQMDLISVVGCVKIDDATKIYSKGDISTTIGEIELKNILKKFNMYFVSEGKLNKCLRGVTSRYIPKYDWECAFLESLQANLEYFEANDYYQLSKFNNITLKTTSFVNIDPSYV